MLTRIPYLIFLGYLAFTLFINLIYANYPTDNDLDEIGWIVANLSIHRLESFANAAYPFGFPVLLYLTTPIFDGLLNAALIIQSFACTVILLLACRISMQLFADISTGMLTIVVLSLILFQSATSEYADSIACAFSIASFYFLICKKASQIAILTSGILCGVAYLFRYHYLVFLIVMPLVMLLRKGITSQQVCGVVVFILGFLAGCIPLLIINFSVNGELFANGFSSYFPGIFATGDLNWDDFLNTYNTWPISKLINHRPGALLRLFATNSSAVLNIRLVIFALLLVPLTFKIAKGGQSIWFLWATMIVSVTYTILVIIPTRYTDRAFMPPTILLSIAIGPALMRLRDAFAARFWGLLYIIVIVAVVAPLKEDYHHVAAKRERASYNWVLLEALSKGGMKNNREVFSNDTNVFPLNDPGFVAFYNWGEWLLLDEKYAGERPIPRARTADEWRQFMLDHGLRFLVLNRSKASARPFDASLSADWVRIYSDEKFVILRLAPQA